MSLDRIDLSYVKEIVNLLKYVVKINEKNLQVNEEIRDLLKRSDNNV